MKAAAQKTFGLGCMRLTDVPRDRAIATLRTAVSAGITVFDTADAYFGQGGEPGDNERLLAEALTGAPAGVRFMTKVGLLRPGTRWLPCGKRSHILKRAEASAENLKRPADILLLHVIDPKVAFKTQIAALVAAQKKGFATTIGLSNVTVPQLEEARAMADIRAVQVEVSPFNEDALRSGLVERCIQYGIEVFGFRPLGGVKGALRIARQRKYEALGAPAGRAGALLAWLAARAPHVCFLPGATTPEHAKGCTDVMPESDAMARADTLLDGAKLWRTTRAQRRPCADAPGEVVLIMGAPGVGKTTRAQHYVDAGYTRFNRDVAGGRLRDLLPPLAAHLTAHDAPRAVLDNTYPTRAQRNHVIETAWAAGVPVRVEHMLTDMDTCLTAACARLIARAGKLASGDELKTMQRKVPEALPPRVVRAYFTALEPPTRDEGFTQIDPIEHNPQHNVTAPDVHVVDADALRLADHASRAVRLREAISSGVVVIVYAFRPGATDAALDAEQAQWQAEIHPDVVVSACRHAAPPRCWCMKPLPGAVLLPLVIRALWPCSGIVIGDTAQDRTLARRLGFSPQSYADYFESQP